MWDVTTLPLPKAPKALLRGRKEGRKRGNQGRRREEEGRPKKITMIVIIIKTIKSDDKSTIYTPTHTSHISPPPHQCEGVAEGGEGGHAMAIHHAGVRAMRKEKREYIGAWRERGGRGRGRGKGGRGRGKGGGGREGGGGGRRGDAGEGEGVEQGEVKEGGSEGNHPRRGSY
jgi:uncharacterized membrane protein YgcG